MDKASLGASVVAYDSEFVRDRHYFPKLSLMQIAMMEDGAHANSIWSAERGVSTSIKAQLYDALNLDAQAPIWKALLNHHAPIVIHAGKQDLEMLMRYSGRLPLQVRDTQIGYGLCSKQATIGLADLCRHYLGVEPDKGQTRSDWLKRPLTLEQLNYAANDVGWLLRVYPYLCADLHRLGRLGWWAEDSARLLHQSYEQVLDYAWYKLPFANQLSSAERRVAHILVSIREEVARSQDLPRQKVLHDKQILSLIKYGVRQLDELAEHLSARHILWQAHDALCEAFDNPALPVPDLPRNPRMRPVVKAFYQQLQAKIDAQAKELEIASNAIILPRQLKHWCAQENWQTGLLREGWRNTFFGQYIDRYAP